MNKEEFEKRVFRKGDTITAFGRVGVLRSVDFEFEEIRVVFSGERGKELFVFNIEDVD